MYYEYTVKLVVEDDNGLEAVAVPRTESEINMLKYTPSATRRPR